MTKDFLWVTNTEENLQFYSDSATKSNLLLHFDSDIEPNIKQKICQFVRYIRKEFYFPVRCNVYFCNQNKFQSSNGGYCYGIFFSNEESQGRIYPQIYIPANNELYQIYHSLCHELTHYFQWFFYDDRKKNNRSLEIQASKYANRILKDYCNYFCKEPDRACENCCNK